MLYFPLRPRTNQVRLLQVQAGDFNEPIFCNLIIHDLDRPGGPAYEALSYTWGDTCNPSSIFLKGEEFPVRKNLEAALRHLRPCRLPDDKVQPQRFLWIDAVCINQADIQERSEQVLKMVKIYQTALTTIVWLGDGTIESDKAIRFMLEHQDDVSKDDSDLTQPMNYREEFLALAAGILVRPWWERVWIIQEITVSKDVLVVCGSMSVPWWLVAKFIAVVNLYHEPACAQILRQFPRHQVPNTSMGLDLAGSRWHQRDHGKQRLASLLLQFRSWKSTLAIDKIYGVLGLSIEAQEPALKPDYKNLTAQDVYIATTKFIIEQQQKLDFICIATGATHLEGLPTWAPDFTVPSVDVATPLKGRDLAQSLYSAAKDVPMVVSFSQNDRIMSVDGILVDSTSILAPYWDPNLSRQEFRQQLPISMQKWADLAKSSLDKIQTRYGSTYPVPIVMGKTLTADRILDADFKVSRFDNDKSWIDLPEAPPDEYQRHGSSDRQRSVWDDNKVDMVRGAISNRCFMISESGYVGIVPRAAKAGDIFCVLFGCETPLLLRPTEGGSYHKLIGECYIPGIMDGEKIDDLWGHRANRKCFKIC